MPFFDLMSDILKRWCRLSKTRRILKIGNLSAVPFSGLISATDIDMAKFFDINNAINHSKLSDKAAKILAAPLSSLQGLVTRAK